MTRIIIDSNAILHFEWENLPWQDYSGDTAALITVTPVLMREIDSLKPSRQRARNFSSKYLNSFLDNPKVELKSGIEIIFEDISPSQETFKQNSLDSNKTDEIYIATALQLKELYPNDKVKIVTNDNYMVVRARKKGIDAHKLPDEQALESEQGEQKRVIAKLQKELLEIKNRMPNVRLIFQDGSNLLSFKRPKPFIKAEESIDDQIEYIKSKYPKLERKQKPQDINRFGPIGFTLYDELRYPSQTEYDRYNTQLEIYYKEMEDHFRNLTEIENAKRLRFEFDLVVTNLGSAKATDTRIHFHVPDGCLVYDVSDAPKLSGEPKPPKQPRTYQEIDSELMRSMSVIPIRDYDNRPPPNIKGGSFRKTNSFETNWRIREIKHKEEHYLASIIIDFEKFEDVKSFDVDYSIICDEQPDKRDGILHLIFNQS
jgi:hypothetical protein